MGYIIMMDDLEATAMRMVAFGPNYDAALDEASAFVRRWAIDGDAQEPSWNLACFLVNSLASAIRCSALGIPHGDDRPALVNLDIRDADLLPDGPGKEIMTVTMQLLAARVAADFPMCEALLSQVGDKFGGFLVSILALYEYHEAVPLPPANAN